VINQVHAIENEFFKPKLSRDLTANTLRTVWQKLSQNECGGSHSKSGSSSCGGF